MHVVEKGQHSKLSEKSKEKREKGQGRERGERTHRHHSAPIHPLASTREVAVVGVGATPKPKPMKLFLRPPFVSSVDTRGVLMPMDGKGTL
jgi:hypothetical protein